MNEYNKSSNRNTVRKIYGPGIWEDADGNPHFNVPDLLKFAQLDDTPENRALATKFLMGLITETNPEAGIIERATPEQ